MVQLNRTWSRRTLVANLSVIALFFAVSSSVGGDANFAELRDSYFTFRSVQFAEELLLKEEFLSVLYKCTVAELKLRRNEGLSSKILDFPITHMEAAHFDLESPELANVHIGERYRLWVEFEEGEYQRRYQTILTLRSALIESANADQKQRMFRRELEKTLRYYGDKNWQISGLLFDRLLEDYHYQDVDDLLFYQAEVCIQEKQFDAALVYMNRLLNEVPNSQFRTKSYTKLSEILSTLGNGWDLIRLYRRYLDEKSPGDPAEMGGIHYRAAREEANLGHYQPAVEILKRVDPKSSYYFAAKYFMSDCLSALEEWPQAVDALTELIQMKRKNIPYDRWRMLIDEARIKLAYIYYEWEEYDKAEKLFDQVKSGSPFNDRVLLGKAWIAFQLDAYEEAIETSEELLRIYPLSTEIYEAGSLAGYCYEQIGEKNAAMASFYSVLEAGVGKNKLQTFSKERRRIHEALAQLQALEESVFSADDEQTFEDYKRARNLLEICLKRIGLAELLEVNAEMRSLVAERVLLNQLAQEHRTLEEEVIRTEDVELMADFVALEDRIYTIIDHLGKIGLEHIKSTPLYYKEAQIGYVNTLADTLSARIESGIASLQATLGETAQLYNEAFASKQADKCIEFGLRLDQGKEVLGQSYYNHTLAETSRRPMLTTRVDRWSDFSFNRYAMGGMEFDELERKYERLQQVEDYLLTLEEMALRPLPADTVHPMIETPDVIPVEPPPEQKEKQDEQAGEIEQ